jgi:acyl carrier protein
MDAFLKGADSAANTNAGSHDTMDRIRKVFLESLHLNLKEEDLDYERKLDESVGLDSLAVLQFITGLEKEFGFVIDPEMLQLDVVRDLPRLASHIEERAARLSRPRT